MQTPLSAVAMFRPAATDHDSAAILAAELARQGRQATQTAVLRFALKTAREAVERGQETSPAAG